MKRSLYFGNPYVLKTLNNQLLIFSDNIEISSIPIEDIGTIILDHRDISLSTSLIESLSINNVATIVCGQNHNPSAMFMPLDSHFVQAERFQVQIEASKSLKDQIWTEIIRSKIINQSHFLNHINKNSDYLISLSNNIKIGDLTNREAIASKYYWKELFEKNFKRERFGRCPNDFLNYGYTILRSAVARGLCSVGLLPTFGIHHCNKYNSFQLADDMIEPFRPWIDKIVYENFTYHHVVDLNKEMKAKLIQVLNEECLLDSKKYQLQKGIELSCFSLFKCLKNANNKIIFPSFLE